MTRALGVDVGATKVAAAIVDPATGAVEAYEVVPTRAERAGRDVLEDCVALAERIADGEPVTAVGIGVCELVDLDGLVTTEQSVRWRGLDVAEAFASIGAVIVESDVRAAALAEARYGAAQARHSCLYVILGTGLSSCLLLDGAPVAGAHGNAILIGAAPLEVEAKASGKAIARRFGTGSAREVSQAAAAGDERAAEVLRDAGSSLGDALAFVVNLLDPEAIVLGGGVALNAPLVFGAAERSMRAQISADTSREIPFLLGELGERAGVVGAAIAAASAVSVGAA